MFLFIKTKKGIFYSIDRNSQFYNHAPTCNDVLIIMHIFTMIYIYVYNPAQKSAHLDRLGEISRQAIENIKKNENNTAVH